MNNSSQKPWQDLPLIVAITGASGIIYAFHLLQTLKKLNICSHLIVSSAARLTLKHESTYALEDLKQLADHYHGYQDIGASPASGSFQSQGMIILPCSMNTLAQIAVGITPNLIARSADVILKERRRLVLVTRECPLNLTHLKNMQDITMMGGIIFPPVPAFYMQPKTIEDLVHHTVGRILDLFFIEIPDFQRWEKT